MQAQQTHQRWINVDRQHSSTLFQRWYLVENESWANVHLSTWFQRWNNVDRITSIQRRWTKVVSMLKFGWKWKLSRRIFIDVVSTLTKQRWNNFDRVTTLIQCWWLNVVSMLILGWKGKLSQGMFIRVGKIGLKQLSQHFLSWGLLDCGSVIKQN